MLGQRRGLQALLTGENRCNAAKVTDTAALLPQDAGHLMRSSRFACVVRWEHGFHPSCLG